MNICRLPVGCVPALLSTFCLSTFSAAKAAAADVLCTRSTNEIVCTVSLDDGADRVAFLIDDGRVNSRPWRHTMTAANAGAQWSAAGAGWWMMEGDPPITWRELAACLVGPRRAPDPDGVCPAGQEIDLRELGRILTAERYAGWPFKLGVAGYGRKMGTCSTSVLGPLDSLWRCPVPGGGVLHYRGEFYRGGVLRMQTDWKQTQGISGGEPGPDPDPEPEPEPEPEPIPGQTTFEEIRSMIEAAGEGGIIWQAQESAYDFSGCTGPNNSMAQSAENWISPLRSLLVYEGQLTNVHWHSPLPTHRVLTAYRYSGRFNIDNANAGVGLTWFSDYPATDRYYRVRRADFAGGHKMHFDGHAAGPHRQVVMVSAAPKRGIWYDFSVEVLARPDATMYLVMIQSSPEGVGDLAEPEVIFRGAAYDDTAGRLKGGTFGVWCMGPGHKWFGQAMVERLVIP